MGILKKIWIWVSHGDTVWGILNMVFSAIGGISGGIISWLNSVSPIFIFFSVFGGIALGLLISNELAARRQRKRGLLATNDSVIQIPEWLEMIASQDLDNIKQRIRAEVREVKFGGLEAKEPSFELTVRIVNTSIFRVKLLRCDGFIQLSGSQCVPPQLYRFPEIEHGTGETVDLHQSLNDRTAQWLIEQGKNNSPINIVCNTCQFVFQVTSEGYNRQIEIPIREGGLPCIPKGIVVVSNGHIGRLTS